MAKSRSIGGIYASLTLRDGGFRKGLAAARKELVAFGGKAATGMAVGMAAASAALAAGTLRTLDQVDALGDLSAQTGVAISDMMKLQRAYKDGGRDASKAATDIGKMQKSIFEAAAGGKDPFATIGLSAEKLLKMSPAEQFEAIGDAIMRIENPAERTAKAMEIFGKGGMGLTSIFPSLKEAEKNLGRMPELAQQFAGAMGEANDAIGRLPLKSDQFFTGFTAGIIGEILPHLREVDNYDFTNVGENLGKSLAVGLQVLTDGTVWDLFQLHAEKAMTTLSGAGQGGSNGGLLDQIVNGWAASINAMEVHAYGGGGWGKYDEARDKYLEEGTKASEEAMQSRIDRLDELQSKIDELNNRTGEKFTFKRKEAENVAPKPDIPDPTRNVAAMEAALKKATSANPFTPDVNDYQRRGLSLDGNHTPRNSKTESLLEKGVILLERISKTREPLKF